MTSDRALTASAIAERHVALQPHVWARYGARGVQKCAEDAAYHLSFLAEAWTADDPTLFSAYVRWAGVVLESRAIAKAHLVENLRLTEDVLGQHAAPDDRMKLQTFMKAATDALQDSEASGDPSHLRGDAAVDIVARSYLDALLHTDREGAHDVVFQALADGISMREIYLRVFERTQYEIGRLWQTNALSVAQEHYCTAATQTIMAQLYERLDLAAPRGKTIVAICVSGELHDMGLRIVCDFLEMDGWDTVYCGSNTPVAGILAMLRAENAHVLAISATMTFHLGRVKEIVDAVKTSDVKVKVIVGGAPFRASPDLWKAIGADAFADSAAEATEAVAHLV